MCYLSYTDWSKNYKKRKVMLIIISIIAALFMGSNLMASNYYVSPTGSDLNPGSKEKPLATLEGARNAVRWQIANGMKEDITVHLAAGNYFVSKPVIFDDRDSGRNGHTITYKGAPNLDTRIFGGMRVIGWKKISNTEYEAQAPTGKTHYTLYENDLSANGGLFHTFPGLSKGNWNTDGKTIRYAPRNLPIEDQVIVVGTAKDVIVVKGRSMKKIAENIIFDGLHMIGSEFAPKWRLGATWNACWDGIYDGKEWGGKPLGDAVLAPDMRHGQFLIENARKITIRNSRLYGAGFMGAMFNRWAQENLVENCWIENAGCNGLFFLGWEPGRGPFKTVAESDVNKKNRVRNNVFLNIGRFAFDGAGIYLTFSGENIVEHNIFHGMTRYGLAIKGWRPKVINYNYYYALKTKLAWDSPEAKPFDQKHITFYDGYVVTDKNKGAELVHSRNNIVRYNDFSQIAREESGDMGMIEMWGAGTGNIWEYNACHDGVQAAGNWDSWLHVLFNDDGCNEAVMRGNIIYWVAGGGAAAAIMCKGDQQVTVDNIIADCELRAATIGPYVESAEDMIWSNNIVSITNANPVRGNKWMKEVKNNLYAENPMGPKPVIPHSPHIADRLPKPGEKGLKPNDDVGSINADPRFVYKNPWWNVDTADYVLKPDSPALKLGFKQTDISKIGLRKDYPFNLDQVFAHPAGAVWCAADYSRIYKARIHRDAVKARRDNQNIAPGSWVRYNGVDFEKGKYKNFRAHVIWPEKTLSFVGTSDGKKVPSKFINQKKETSVPYWEVSKVYKVAGKTGPELFDVAFSPEKNPNLVKWQTVTDTLTSRTTLLHPLGVLNCDVVNGEENEQSAAYMRSSIYANNAAKTQLKIEGSYGLKVWLNGNLIYSKLGTDPAKPATVEADIKQGWNQFLVKVVQNDKAWKPVDKGWGNFWAGIKVNPEKLGGIHCLPGLPGEANEVNPDGVIELRLDAPDGPGIGEIVYPGDSCGIKKTTGRHDLFIVFPKGKVKEVKWFLFSSDKQEKTLKAITPVKASETTHLGTRDAENTIDGSGLSANNRYGKQNGEGNALNHGQWLSNTGDTNPEITFDLGSALLIQQLHIWNYSESPLAKWGGRGVNAVDVYGSSTSNGPWTLLGSIKVAKASSDKAEAAQTFDFKPQAFRYVRFDIGSNHDGDKFTTDLGGTVNGGDLVGLGEVKFSVIPNDKKLNLKR